MRFDRNIIIIIHVLCLHWLEPTHLSTDSIYRYVDLRHGWLFMIFAKVSTSVVRDRINRLVDSVVHLNTHSSSTTSTEGSSYLWNGVVGVSTNPKSLAAALNSRKHIGSTISAGGSDGYPASGSKHYVKAVSTLVLTSLATTTRHSTESSPIWVIVCLSRIGLLVGFYCEHGSHCIYVPAFYVHHAWL